MVGMHVLRRSRYGLTRQAADAQRAARLMHCVCAVRAVVLGVNVPRPGMRGAEGRGKR